MNNKSRNILAAILAVAVLVLIFVPRYMDKYMDKEIQSAPTPEMTALVAEMKTDTNQNDGSVIVHDKGASFAMAPVTSSQPPVVTEQEVRSRSVNRSAVPQR